jgi:hypothetical protein
MKTTELAERLCKMFRRHDDDIAVKQIADVLARFAAEVRYVQLREAAKRAMCFTSDLDYHRRMSIEEAITERAGWFDRGYAKDGAK